MSDERYLPKDRDGRLFRLVEECGEVMQAVGKAGRFGMRKRFPAGDRSNVEKLLSELDDLEGAIHDVRPDLVAERNALLRAVAKRQERGGAA